MKVAFISSEAVPYAKTGGLGDVAGVLPKALEHIGCEVKLFVPKYSSIDEEKHDLHYCWEIGAIPVRVANHTRSIYLHKTTLPGSKVEVIFIDCPHYFHRGTIYSNAPDEDERYILFNKGVIEALQRLQWVPDIIHCNDWPTGLLPLFLKDNYRWDRMFEKTATIFSIHNIGYQGKFSHNTLFKGEIKEEYFYPGGPVEFQNSVSFMKAALSFSDVITTVSKTYAHEILTAEYGAGLDGILRQRQNDLYGILNGVDYSVWNPAVDKYLPFRYSHIDMAGKNKNKQFLLEHFNLPYNPDVPLIGIISRLVNQKGFDILAQAAESLLQFNAQWIILGNGEDHYEDFFVFLSQKYPQKVGAYIGFNNELSHLIEAGSDLFLMPSKYEPCGLNQIYSLKYGTVPIVRKTGGLADTVHDWDEYKSQGLEIGTGITFNDYSSPALYQSVQRALHIFWNKPVYLKIQQNGMAKDFSWERSAKEYLQIYKQTIKNLKS